MVDSKKINKFPFFYATKSWPDYLFIVGLIIFSITSSFSISLSQIGLGLAIIGLVKLVKQNKVKLRKTQLDIAFSCFVLAGLFSLFYAEELFQAIINLKKYFVIFVFYIAFTVRFSEYFQKLLLKLVVIFSTIVSAIGVIQFYSSGASSGRISGFFSTALTFGECQALVALLVITWFCTIRANFKIAVLLFGSLSIIMMGLMLSGTRGAWIGFFVGFMFLIVRFPKKLMPVAFLLMIGVCFSIYNVPMFKERVEGMGIQKNLKVFHQTIDGEFENDAIEANFRRLRVWQIGFVIVKKMPMFGVGINNVKHWYRKSVIQFERDNSLIFGHQHNNFMQILVMTGLFGLTMFFWFLVNMAQFLMEIPNKIESKWQKDISRGAIAILFCFIATGLTEYSWGDEEVAMLAFFLMGLMVNPAQLQDSCNSV